MVPQELQASLPGFRVAQTPAAERCVLDTKKRNPSWSLLFNHSPISGQASLELVSVSMAELRECAGQMHAVALLDSRAVLPLTWRRFDLLFYGTKWVDTKGMTRIAQLKYSRFLGWRLRWCIHGRRLDTKKVRAVVIQQQTQFVAA